MHDEALRYLKILELDAGANIKDVKKSFKLLSMAWHPDRFVNESHKLLAEEKQKKINEAYNWLSKNKEILLEISQKDSKRKPKNPKKKRTRSRAENSKNKHYKNSSNSSSRRRHNFINIGSKNYRVEEIKRVEAKEYSNYYFRIAGLLTTGLGVISFISGIFIVFG